MHLFTIERARICKHTHKKVCKVLSNTGEHYVFIMPSELHHHFSPEAFTFFGHKKLPTAPLSRQPFLRALVHFLGLRGEVPSSGVKGVSSSGVKGVGLHQVLKV